MRPRVLIEEEDEVIEEGPVGSKPTEEIPAEPTVAEAGFTPDVIVSDGAPAYPPAMEEAVPGAQHVVAQFRGTQVSHRGRSFTVSNNLLERLNGTFRGWVRTLCGFKSRAAGNGILAIL